MELRSSSPVFGGPSAGAGTTAGRCCGATDPVEWSRVAYQISLQNSPVQALTAVLLVFLGAWATALLYRRGRPGPGVVLALVALSSVLAVPLLLMSRRDGPCSTVWGFPVVQLRESAACADMVSSTGISILSVWVNLLVAVGLAHAIVLVASWLRRPA